MTKIKKITKALKMLQGIWSDCKYEKQRDKEVRDFVEGVLIKQEEDFKKIVQKVNDVDVSNGRYNACKEILALLK